jgi:8-oxo-dGTP pyrophosphatase MutT (NUDIX family)
MAFAGGALVFPGGRVDPADRVLAEIMAPDMPDAAYRIAAVREAIEETGVGVGLEPAPAAAAIGRIRAALHGGAALGEALRSAGLSLALDRLVPFARWLPDHAPRVFDTHFYLAEAPEGAEASPDGGESVHLFWATAGEVLDRADAGQATLIFPTRRTLERLARFSTFAEAVADATAHPIRAINPWVERREDGEHLCIPDDLGYPVTSEPMGRVLRA